MIDSFLYTASEMQYRLLLLLSSLPTDDYSCQWLSGMDFIVDYGHPFGVSESNLHGDNWMKFTEYATKIVNVSEALRILSCRGWVKMNPARDGFTWRITASGTEMADAFSTSYAIAYRDIVRLAFHRYGDLNEEGLNEVIMKVALSSREQEVPHG